METDLLNKLQHAHQKSRDFVLAYHVITKMGAMGWH